jgi:membrane protease subunit HflC
VIAGAVAAAAYFALFVVHVNEQAIVLEFGKPVRIISEPGLYWKIPVVQTVDTFDKRILDLDTAEQEVTAADQKRLKVDAFARYRIVDPLLMYIRSTTEENLRGQLQTILRSEVRNELGRQPFVALLSPERQGVMDDVRKSLNVQAAKFGVEIVDVRIKKTDLPDGTPLQSAFESMRTAREQEARSIRAQGRKQAIIIQAEADAQASRTYAASFGKDAQFYDFYRAMQSYKTTFIGDPGGKAPAPTTIVLSPQNDYLKEFTGRSR